MNHPTQQPKPTRWRVFVFIVLAFFICCFTTAAVTLRVMAGPGPLVNDTLFWLKPGATGWQIAADLAEIGALRDKYSFMLALRAQTDGTDIRAGEYELPARASVLEIISQLRGNAVIERKITVPEGLTVREVAQLINNNPYLSGGLGALPPEGSLLPETYHIERGELRAEVMSRMQGAMTATLAELWLSRAAGLPYQSPQEALVMASIIEKETGIAAERERVAGVFVNRLKKGMKLQADPTVIYALTLGQRDLGRELTRADWRVKSPFNTYYTTGLPPTPIANPGRASIEAALNPEQHNYLFFVANGTGGHEFAETLAKHNKNVTRWREIRKEP